MIPLFPTRRLPALLLATAAACVTLWSAASARQVQSLDNLKGKYAGTFTPNSGTGGGTLKVQITKDKERDGSRAILARVSFGKKKYTMRGAFELSTRQLNLAARVGPPQRSTLISLTGFFNEEGTAFDGGYTFTSMTGTTAGDATFTLNAR